jgi:hypothetical protein
MSYSHIQLIKIFADTNIVTYEISSPDFSKDHKWEKLGTIEINFLSKTYMHKNNALWEKYKIYPIEIQELNREKRIEIIEQKYQGYGSGRWSMNIFNFIQNCLMTKDCPEKKVLVS